MLRRTVLAIAIVATLAGAVAAQYLMALPERDPPTFDQSTPLNINAAENQTAVTTVSATGEGTITYSLSGTDDEFFSIGPSTGVITFNSAPNYENPLDDGFDNVYTFTANASNGSVSSITVNVTVTDESEGSPEAPTIVNANPLNVNVQEGATTIATITATGDAPLTYSVSGTDADDVSIGSSSGVLVFDPAPDYEIPTDSNTDNIYTFTVTASNGVSPDDSITVNATVTDYDESFPTLANIDTMQAAADDWNIPDEATWWKQTPTPSQVKAALRDPYINDPGGNGLCIRRLFFKNESLGTTGAANLGSDAPLTDIITRPQSPADNACYAWYAKEVQSDNTTYDTRMGWAKSKILGGSPWTDGATLADANEGLRAFGNEGGLDWGAVCALDWIVWDDMTEFETAFEIVREQVEDLTPWDTKDARGDVSWPEGRGYYENDPVNKTCMASRTALALCVWGINPGGASHAWANAVLDTLGPESEPGVKNAYNPIHVCNMMSMLALQGMSGTMADNTFALGSYESYYANAFAHSVWSFDSATNYQWSLLEDNLWLSRRVEEAVWEMECAVNRTGDYMPEPQTGLADITERLSGDGRWRWVMGRYRWKFNSGNADLSSIVSSPNAIAIRLLAGPKKSAVAPTSGPASFHSGARFYYKDDPANPESGLRFGAACRSWNYGRYIPPPRGMWFCYNNIGLCYAGPNRNVHIGAYANGIQIGDFYSGTFGSNPKPAIGVGGGWPYENGIGKSAYWDSQAAANPSDITDNSYHVYNTEQWQESGGVYTRTEDWTNQCHNDWDIDLATTEWTLTPSENKLVIVDTIQPGTPGTTYVGWHFSPSQAVTVINTPADGFTFTDGTDTIRVLVEPLDGLALDLTQRDTFTMSDGTEYTIDYTQTQMGVTRVAKNIGYTPTASASQYRVRVTIEANP